jgi:uncharacterized protein YjbI with pentapeptide repeats
MSRKTEELFNRYAAGERNFSGISLDGNDLSGVNLSGADLSNSGLGEAYLEEAMAVYVIVKVLLASFNSTRTGSISLS